jgi:hypothetical protein
MLQDVIVPYHKAQPNPTPNQGMVAPREARSEGTGEIP